MTTPAFSPGWAGIKFSDIVNEFGRSPNRKFGDYRVSQAIAGRNWSLDDGIPSSGPLKFSHFTNKTLNVIVDYPPGGDEVNVIATDKYISGKVVGGYKNLPSLLSSQTKKVKYVIRKTIGASYNDGVAFRSGNWDSSTVYLGFIITNSGEIIGKGGDGGNGVTPNYSAGGTAGSGQDGSPAILTSRSCEVIVENGGKLYGGSGGGGGAGGGACEPDDNPADPKAGGGGGGGGAGYPPGNGGSASGSDKVNYGATNGNPGTKYAGGRGGNGAGTQFTQGPRDCASGGGGGGGGGPTVGNGGSRGLDGCGSAQDGSPGSSLSGGRGGDGHACRRGAGSASGGTGGNAGLSVAFSPGATVILTVNAGSSVSGSTGTSTLNPSTVSTTPPPPVNQNGSVQPSPGGGGGKIICKKLNELGYFDDEMNKADQRFGILLRKNDPEAYYGYLRWARTVVDLMDGKGSENLRKFVFFWERDKEKRIELQKNVVGYYMNSLARPWAEEMAYRMKAKGYDKSNPVGKLVMEFGLPLCRKINKIQSNKKLPLPFKIVMIWSTVSILLGYILIVSNFKKIFKD